MKAIGGYIQHVLNPKIPFPWPRWRGGGGTSEKAGFPGVGRCEDARGAGAGIGQSPQPIPERPASLQPAARHLNLPSARPTCRGPDLGTRLCPFPGAAKIPRVAKKLSGSAAAGEGREGLQSVLHTMNTATSTCLCQSCLCVHSLFTTAHKYCSTA